MSQDGREAGISGQTVGFLTIAVGFAIIVAGYMNASKDWLLVIPIVLIECGVYGIAMGLFSETRGQKTTSKWGNDPAYTMFWGSLIAMVGVMWIVNNAWPNNLPALASAFLIWFGVSTMMITRRKDSRPKLW